MIKLGNPKRIVMAGVTLGCALGIGYFMQLSTQQNASAAQQVDVDTIDTDAFAEAFVGGTPSLTEDQEPDVAGATEIPLEDKIAEAGTETLPLPLEADAGKQALFEDASMIEEQNFEASPQEPLGFDNVMLTSAEPVPPVAAPQPEALPDAPVQLAALQDAPIAQMPMEEAAPALVCEIAMTATASAAAMVQLEVSAPCLSDTQFTVHHNGMMFSALTDNDGAWSMQVPALAKNAVFIAAFDNGEGAVADVSVDTLDYYDRFVVQWKGESGLQIHAMEYGADYGEAGHVWHDAARDMAVAAKGEGGFLVRLGEGVIEDTTLIAEVYTFPTQNALRDGDVQISVETEVHAGNCGRDIEAQALVRPGAGEINARDLTMAIPDCEAIGDFLVLNNLYEDLKIARN